MGALLLLLPAVAPLELAAGTPTAAVQEAPALAEPGWPIHVATAAEGAVYAAFLDQTFAPVSDEAPATRETLLVENDSLDAWTPNRRAWEKYLLDHNSGQGRADQALLDAFLARPQQVIRFYQFPPSQNPVKLLRSDVVEWLLAHGGWDAFYKAYPRTGGVLAFSGVAFKADASEALFTASQRCGAHCGYRDLVLMRMVNGAWTLVMQDSLP